MEYKSGDIVVVINDVKAYPHEYRKDMCQNERVDELKSGQIATVIVSDIIVNEFVIEAVVLYEGGVGWVNQNAIRALDVK